MSSEGETIVVSQPAECLGPHDTQEKDSVTPNTSNARNGSPDVCKQDRAFLF